MSSIHLLKEHKGKKPGTVITVPFLAARELIKAGIGEPWNGGIPLSKTAAAAPAETPDFGVEDYRAAIDRIHRLEALCAERDGENDELKAANQKLVAENTELKELMKSADAPPAQTPGDKPTAEASASSDKPKKPGK